MNNLETFLKHTKDKNGSLINLFNVLKDIENEAAIKMKTAISKFQHLVYSNSYE